MTDNGNALQRMDAERNTALDDHLRPEPQASAPACRSALAASISYLSEWDEKGILLDEIENWTEFTERVVLLLHEMKRLQNSSDKTVTDEATGHAVELSQCALFVDSAPLRKAMTDAADFLRTVALERIGPGAWAPAVHLAIANRRIAELEEAFRSIAHQYDNQDLSHRDFRVKTMAAVDTALHANPAKRDGK